ncbi:hypothetical protein [Aliarcobacter butzleri]|uniref:SPOR domain-containing protein n=1 Tax=Aliarcobacter butzleri L351 TaxID=1447259 RepID=A0A837J5A6_9BACT|nr:hypothetical protein [Aliarcobacter butzleri]KLE00726.1 hypothetical protein AF76_06490 [Aliarcobacter butzleri L351]KLE11903.1 hypothetical protein AF75_11570 [Aliarcobacter butzleri L350]MDN5047678.1 hypothetical protein [Aliarcobacter butzleri]
MPNKESENKNPNVEEKKTTDTVDEAIEENSENKDGLKSNNFLRKILIYVIAFLISILVIISIFYIFDFFVSNKEEKNTQVVMESPVQATTSQEETQTVVKQEEPVKHEEYNFDFNSLDPDKLNEQLSLLTNKNIEQSRLEKLKAENEKKLLEEKKINEPVLKDNATTQNETTKTENGKTQNETLKNNNPVLNQNSSTNEKIPTKTSNEQTIKKEDTSTQQTTETSNPTFIKLINVAKIKGELKKNFLDKVISINPNVHLCRDEENIIELYFGPFSDDETRKELYNKLVSKGFKEAYELEMTQEAFDKSCNY